MQVVACVPLPPPPLLPPPPPRFLRPLRACVTPGDARQDVDLYLSSKKRDGPGGPLVSFVDMLHSS